MAAGRFVSQQKRPEAIFTYINRSYAGCCKWRTGAAVPLRWARRGWPGAPGSGCSCMCGGSSAGKPGTSLTWSSSPCQWGRAPRWCQGWHWKSCSSAGLADRRNTGRCKQKPSLLWSGCVARSTQTPREKIKPAGPNGKRGKWWEAGPIPPIFRAHDLDCISNRNTVCLLQQSFDYNNLLCDYNRMLLTNNTAVQWWNFTLSHNTQTPVYVKATKHVLLITNYVIIHSLCPGLFCVTGPIPAGWDYCILLCWFACQ